MRRLFLIASAIVLVFSIGIAQERVYWTESFEETVWPSSSSSSETSVSAATGAWKVFAAFRTTSYKNTGSASLSLTTNSYFTTPIVSGGIKEISFYSRSTGSARPLAFYVTTDGTNFTSLGTGSSGTSTGFVVSTISVNNINVKAIKVVVTGGGTAIFDDVTLVSMIVPTITVSETSLPNFGTFAVGETSSSASYTVSGAELSDNILITAPAGFQVSKDNAIFSNSVSLTQSGGTVASTTVYVNFAPSAASGSITGKITHTSASATTKNVSVGGTAIAAEPTVQSSITIGVVTGTSIVVNFSDGNGAGRIVTAKAGSAVTWLPTDGVSPTGVNSEFSAAQDQEEGNRVVYAGSGSSVTVTGLATGSQYYFAVYEYNGEAVNACNFLLTSPGTGNATTSEEPGLTVDPSVIAFGNVIQGISSAEKTYLLSGSFLTPSTGTITVTAPSGYQISKTSVTGFSSSVNVSYSSSTLPATAIFVRFTPTAIASYIGTITNTGGGAPTKNVAVSGNGIDSSILFIKTYYVAPDGNDSNAGTIDAPFYRVSAAVALAKARDTIYMRGGTYAYNTMVSLTQSGSEGKMICLWAYPGEKPILNFSTQPYGSSYRAFLLKGNYWYIKGLEICYAGDNGIKVEGSYNKIELCVLHHNGDTGIQLGFGHVFSASFPGISQNDGTYCSNNYILNCDSYLNYDPDSNGGDADGFACKMHNGMGNVFRGCRAWQNSDDGWDLFETDFAVVIDSCWTWASGVAQGNGNGFKLGGNGTGGDSKGIHIVSNSVAFGHKVNGFTNNSHKDGTVITNCLSFSNGTSGYNYYFEGSLNSGKSNTFKNNVGIPKAGGGGNLTYDVLPIQFNNSWNLSVTANSADYGSLTEAAALAPRQPCGTIPTGFARLVAGSDLIDKGIDVGLPFYGSAPDLGPFEYIPPTSVEENKNENEIPKSYLTLQNFPNPFNPSTQIQFNINHEGLVVLKIYDVLGREVATLVHAVMKAGNYAVRFDASRVGSGVYYAVLQNGAQRIATKMLLTK